MHKQMIVCVVTVAFASCALAGYIGNSYRSSNSYKSYAPDGLTAIGVLPGGYSNYGPSVPSISLTGIPSNPTSSSSASAQQVGLQPGTYTSLVVPSFEFISGEVVNTYGGYPTIAASSYGKGKY